MDRSKDLEDSRGPCDITLVAKNGEQFKAHRQILSESSPFFEKLFNSDMRESRHGVVEMEIFTQPQMAEILEFVYTGSIEISNLQKAEDLIAVADYLLLDRLSIIAQKFIAQNLSTTNCISYYYLAEKFNCEELMNSSRKFIHLNFATVAESEEFMNLPSNEVEKWISSDHIVIREEEDVFKVLLKWIKQEKSQRRVKFAELFRHVRLTCMSRDFLVTDVVTNDLVQEDKNCLDSVTTALKWVGRAADCHVSRPHRSREVLESTVIVACGVFKPFDCFCYLPGKAGDWYRLPTFELQEEIPFCGRIKHVVSHRGHLYAIFDSIDKSKCYDPDLNHWYPAPWTNRRDPKEVLIEEGKIVKQAFVVKNEMCFISSSLFRTYKTPPNKLCRFNLESHSISLPIHWVNRQSSCIVTCDKYIFAIGGFMLLEGTGVSVRSEAARFDAVENKWEAIAPIQEARFCAFGVVVDNKIFIGAGVGKNSKHLKTCEVYNMLVDEWQSIASLTIPRSQGYMVLASETLYVLGGYSQDLFSPLVECYDHEKERWNEKTLIPYSEERQYHSFTFKVTSLNVFKGFLNNLKVVEDIGNEVKT